MSHNLRVLILAILIPRITLLPKTTICCSLTHSYIYTPLCFLDTAWETFASGDIGPTLLASGDPAVPSSTAVYQVTLEDPLVAVRVVIAESGAYALFLEHGTDEIPVELISAAGEVLVPGAEEVGEEEEEEEEETSPATGKQWANALVASFVISMCRYNYLWLSRIFAFFRVKLSPVVASHLFLYSTEKVCSKYLMPFVYTPYFQYL